MLKPKLDVVLGVRGNKEVIAKLKPDYLKHWLKLVPKWWIEDWGWDLKVEGAGEDAEERERMVAGGKEEEAQEVVEREEEEGEESRESSKKKRVARCWAWLQENQRERSKREKRRRVMWCELNEMEREDERYQEAKERIAMQREDTREGRVMMVGWAWWLDEMEKQRDEWKEWHRNC